MKKTIFAAALAALLTTAAHAQQSPQGIQSSPASTSTQPAPQFNPDAIRASDTSRIQAVKSSLNLTPDQAKKWPEAEAAATRYNEARLGSVIKARGHRPPSDPLVAMQERADNIQLMGNSLRALVDGLKPLYVTLNEEQKQKLTALAGFAVPQPSIQRSPMGTIAPAPAAPPAPPQPAAGNPAAFSTSTVPPQK